MFSISRHSSNRQAASPQARAFAVAPWRIWTALLTVIAFAVLVSTAATHHHASVADDQDCAICSVVTHKLSDVPLVNLPKLVLTLVSYAPYLLATPTITHAFPLLLPPSCGPPAGTSAIC